MKNYPSKASTVNRELPCVQAGFRKGRDQIANICWIMEKGREFQKNIYFCFTDYAKVLDCVDHNKLWKFFKRWKYQTTFSAFWEICMQVKKQQLELDMEQWTVPNWERSTTRLYFVTLLIYITYMQSTSCNIETKSFTETGSHEFGWTWCTSAPQCSPCWDYRHLDNAWLSMWIWKWELCWMGHPHPLYYCFYLRIIVTLPTVLC